MIHRRESADSLRGWLAGRLPAGKLLRAASNSVVWVRRTDPTLSTGGEWASSALGKCCPNSKSEDRATENNAEMPQAGHAVGVQPIICPF